MSLPRRFFCRRAILILTTPALLCACHQAATAEARWPGFLGPGGIAVAPGNADQVPTRFGEEGEHVLWKVPSGSGHSSPCIWDRHLFLTAAEDGGRTLVMTAYDRSKGEVLWRHSVEGEVEEAFGHKASHPAAPTPCTDGDRVIFYFGGYGLIARDLATGKLEWEKRFPFSPREFGTGNSPVLFGDSLILSRDGGEDSALWCFDARNGELRWKSPRPGMGHVYASPFIWKNREHTEIVVPGTNSLFSYDPENGHHLWSVGNLCIFPCTVPTGDRDRLYFAAWATPNADSAERARQSFWGDMELTEEEANDPNFIFKRFDANGDRKIAQDELPNSRSRDAFNFVDRDRDGFWSVPELAALGSGNKAPGRNVMVAVEAGHQGELTEKKGVVWTYERSKALPYVPTPLLMDGRIHLVKSGGVVTCLDASSGEAVYGPVRSGVSGEYYASPVAWGDRILLCSQRGTVLILAAGDKFDVLAKNDLGEEIHATPAIVDGTLYLRTSEHLWAIGKKG